MLKSDQETLKQLIKESWEVENKFNYLLSIIEENIKQNIQIKEQIKILPMLIDNNTRLTNNIPKVLSLLHQTISEENSKYSSHQADSFGSIVLNCWKITQASDEEKRETYEILQGFCLNNIKQEPKFAQICGSLCLSRLIENCPLVLAKNYMKCLWENIISYIEKTNFSATSELLDALISLIFAAESLFKPYATITLYKIIEFLTDNDWIKRKLAIDIVYTLANYSPKEVLPMKAQILELLSVLKTDKVKQVREACNVTLKYLKDVNFELESKHETVLSSDNLIDDYKKIAGYDNDTNKTSHLNTKFDVKSLENSFSALVTVNNNKDINNDDDRSRSKNKNRTPGIKKSKGIVSKQSEKKKKTTRNTIKPISTNSKMGYTVEDTEEPYLKTDHNIIKRKDSYNKMKSKMAKVNLSKDIELKGNEKLSRNFTPTKIESKRKLKSKTPEKDPNKSKEKASSQKTSIKFTAVRNKIPRNEIRRENSHSIFKGAVNKDFFNNGAKDNDCINIAAKNLETSPNSHVNKTNIDEIPLILENKDNTEVLSKSLKNKDFPLMITSKKPKMNGDDKNTGNKEEKKESKIQELNVKSMEQIKQNSVNININDLRGSINKGEKDLNEENDDLLKQVKKMSEKQMEIIESLNNLKNYTLENIHTINSRLDKLENYMMYYIENHKCENQNTFIYHNNLSKEKGSSKNIFSPKISKERLHSGSTSNNNNPDCTWNEIFLNLKKNNINEAIILCNRNDNYLLKLTGKMSVSHIREISLNLLDEMISKLLNTLSKNEHTKHIISFIRRIIIEANIELRPKHFIKIKETLINIMNSNKFRLSTEENNMITHINTYISERIHPSKTSSHSPLIQSFATDLNIDGNYFTNFSHNRTTKK